MKNIAAIDKDNKQWNSEIRGRYRQSQIKAVVKVNSEMLQFYWSLGHDIVERKMENTDGSGFFNRLSADLQSELPDAKGFSPTNIKYFKYFYELYSPILENRPQVADEFNCPIIPQVAEELSWVCKYKDNVEAQYALESSATAHWRFGIPTFQTDTRTFQILASFH